MDAGWSAIPGGAVLVCAGVLTCGTPAVVSAREGEQQVTTPLLALTNMKPKPEALAPTCGPCCHGSPSCNGIDGIDGIKPTPRETTTGDSATTGEPPTSGPDGQQPDPTTTTTGDSATTGEAPTSGPDVEQPDPATTTSSHDGGQADPATTTSSPDVEQPTPDNPNLEGPPAIATEPAGCTVERQAPAGSTFALLGLAAIVAGRRRRS